MAGDNKLVQAMRERSRASLEKSARKAGVKNVGHKNKLQLARDIDRQRKNVRNERDQGRRGRELSRRPDDMRKGFHAGHHDKKTGKWIPRSTSKAFWDAYKESILSRGGK